LGRARRLAPSPTAATDWGPFAQGAATRSGRAPWLAPSPIAVTDRKPLVASATSATDRGPRAGASTLMTDLERDGLRTCPLKGSEAPLLASASCHLHSIRFGWRQPRHLVGSVNTPPRRLLRTLWVSSIADCVLVQNCGWLSQWAPRLFSRRLHAVCGCRRHVGVSVSQTSPEASQ
jgi:hypothetical protein